jgi:predicted nucleotidyltransferase component of viral defense system
MRKGLTPNIESIIDGVAQLECIKPYTLCGGTALSIQLGHRMSEDLDFMMWRISKTEKPEVDWPAIEKEIEEKVGEIEHRDILGFDQVAFVVKGVKLSFFVSNNFSPLNERIHYQGNIFLSDVPAILAMKMEVMLRRLKYRDYYDIYSIVKTGYSLKDSMEAAVKYSGHKLNTKSLMIMLSSSRIPKDANFAQMNPVYDVSIGNMRDYLVRHFNE